MYSRSVRRKRRNMKIKQEGHKMDAKDFKTIKELEAMKSEAFEQTKIAEFDTLVRAIELCTKGAK